MDHCVLIALLPVLCWPWQLRDPCGLQCRAHDQGEHRQPVQQD